MPLPHAGSSTAAAASATSHSLMASSQDRTRRAGAAPPTSAMTGVASQPDGTLQPRVTHAFAQAPAIQNSLAAALSELITAPLFAWLYTIMSYQHRHGGGLVQVSRALYADGGIPRFYRGLSAGLLRYPLERLGNVLAMDAAFGTLRPLGVPDAAAAAVASAGSVGCRWVLMPLATLSTVQQVRGYEGSRLFLERVKARPSTLWAGAGGMMTTTVVGSWTWCFAYQRLWESVPEVPCACGSQLRSVAVGFFSSLACDVSTNSLRVLTTFQQTEKEPMGYMTCARKLVREQGYSGLFGRGLSTRLLAGGVNGATFSLAWSFIAQRLDML